MIGNGSYFTATLAALELDADQRADTRRNATDIVGSVMTAYGKRRDGTLDSARIPNAPVTGLVYGRIQSGKTRAMIASTALAFDNGFRISIVMTSNINDLVSQTHFDFAHGLPGVVIFTKDSNLDREIPRTRLHLQRGDGRLLIVCSKGNRSLQNVARFLRALAAQAYPAIIFDDEGDQASLDTNVRRRSRSRIKVAPSPINAIIQNTLRPAVRRHVYVSVTGTPQAVLLQSADSNNRPSFIRMLPPGATYVGGDRFFGADEPVDNPGLIALVARNEQQQLLARQRPIPDGLRASLLFFLVSAGAAISTGRLPEKGYSYLCHPSLKNDEQAIAERKINAFLTRVYQAVVGAGDRDNIRRDLRAAHAQLATTLGAATPAFDVILASLRRYMPSQRLLVINAKVKRQGIDYGRGLNFLIGGNTLSRGIAIRDLLVTYYVREAKISQIDTMHQHARMYGYRLDTLPYTRLFIPQHLYYRFRDIHRSDQDSREFIERHIEDLPKTFPIEVAFGLRATRQGVLEAGKIDTLQPGMHIYPNYIALPQTGRAHSQVLASLREYFDRPGASPDQLERAARSGVRISADEAAALVALIKTKSKNTWRDATIATVMKKVAEELGEEVLLRFRTARRTVREEGFIPTGTLSGAELRAARAADVPTLWVMAATTAEGSAIAAGQPFMYPTFVIPNRFPSLFIFNRGQ